MPPETTGERVTDADDLTESDEKILDELQKGARTKGALVDATELHRNTVGHRLDVLVPSGLVEEIHDTTALYELVEDPREEDGVEEYTRDDYEALLHERDEYETTLTHRLEQVDALQSAVVELLDQRNAMSGQMDHLAARRDELQSDLEDCRAQLEQVEANASEVPIGELLASVSAALTALEGQSPDADMARSELERVQEVLEDVE